MALITCPECKSTVSNQASACPKCGFPFATRGPIRTKDHQTRLVEKTAKSYKAAGCLSGLICISGGVLVVIGLQSEPTNESLVFLGIGLALIGLVWNVLNRIVAWWSHG